MGATWPRCHVHPMRNIPSQVPRALQSMFRSW
nr:hypothetical protein [Alicyclobacillus mengziensis]